VFVPGKTAKAPPVFIFLLYFFIKLRVWTEEPAAEACGFVL